MSQFTAAEVAKIKEERGLNAQQLNALQNAAYQYGKKATKQELLDNFRKLGYLVPLFEEDLRKKYEKKKERPVKITYDLLPSGKVENFAVEEVD